MVKINLRNLDEYEDNFPLKKKFKKRKKFPEEEPKSKSRKPNRS